jgi:hypothetical protein
VGAQEIVAGRAAVFVQLRDQLFRDGMANMVRLTQTTADRMAQVGAGLTAFGVGVSASVFRAVSIFSEYGQVIDDIAQRTGFTAEATSELGFAIEQTGGDIQTLETGAKKLQQTLVAAQEGSSGAQLTFAALGLEFEKLIRLSPEDQFESTLKALASIQDPVVRVARSLEIFGKAGQKLQPLLSGGAVAIDQLRQQARDLGITLSSSDAAAAGTYGDSWDELTKSLRSTQVAIGAALAPTISDLYSRVAVLLGGVAEFASQNQSLVTTVAGLGVAFAGIGSTITAVGLSLRVASTGFGAIASAASSLPFVGAAIGALVSPIGLLAAGLAGGVAAFLAFTDVGQGMVSTIGNAFGSIQSIVSDSMGQISSAIAGGDLVGALQAAWDGIQQSAAVAWDSIKLLALQAVEGIRASFPGLTANVALAWQDLVSVTTAAFIGVRDVVASVWGTVSEFVTSAWNSVVAGVVSMTGDLTSSVGGYFQQISQYFFDVTGGMFDSWADFTATVQTLWADAGTAILQGILRITSGMLDAFATVTEYLSGDNFVSQSLRDAQAQVEEFNALVGQGGQDRRDEIERNRQRRVQESLKIQEQQTTQFTSQIADLQARVAQPIEVPEVKAPLANVDKMVKESKKALSGFKIPDLQFKTTSQGSFSAIGGAIAGANQQNPVIRQNEKMISFLQRIAENTELQEDFEVV